MKLLFNTCILSLLCSFAVVANPQLISGKVVDQKSGLAIANAIIYVESLQQQAETSADGTFTLWLDQNSPFTMKIIRIGYETRHQHLEGGMISSRNLLIALTPRPITMEEIVIMEASDDLSLNSVVYAREIKESSPNDVGLFLKTQPGFGAIRRGGYAIDPVLRGFKYDQLNIQFDGGIRVSNACPNRMDPVTSHIRAQDLEKIEIIKGPYSVRYGQTLGGVVNLVQKRPDITRTLKAHAEVESNYDHNGDGRSARAAGSLTYKDIDVFISGGTQDVGNYRNGDGLEIPSSYRVNDYLMRVGINTGENQRLQLSWRQSFVRDMRHAALPMDSDFDDSNIWSVDYSAHGFGKSLYSITAKAYGSFVDHQMNNRLRPNYAMVHAKANLTSETQGVKLEVGLTPGINTIWYVGADLNRSAKDGNRDRLVFRMNGMTFDPPRAFTDLIWQNSEMMDVGIFSEVRHALHQRTSLVAGARLDVVTSQINNPAPQFTAEYGAFQSREETNLSFTATLNHQFDSQTQLQLAAGRGVRSANLLERYINHLSIGLDAYEYFGNPYLKPEVNHQFDLSMIRNYGKQVVRINGFYSLIGNFISAYVDENLPRLYMPTEEPRYTRRYYNIDQARQMGFEISFYGNIVTPITYYTHLTYIHAADMHSKDPLPEIPPLQANLRLRYTHPGDRVFAETEARIGARQGRISETFGETPTPGFIVVNMRSGIQLLPYTQLTLAIENIFDKTYYEHLSRAYQNMSTGGILYEPGRNFRVGLKVAY